MTTPATGFTPPSLAGKTALVTGGSDGLGLHLVTALAIAGADLILPVRNPEKGARAKQHILDAAPSARVRLESLDLSSLDSVQTLATRLSEEGDPIHLLINNAGVMTPPERQVTADGFELQFGTNHLGHVALMAGVFPLLTAGHARVTSQVSVAANQGSINWADLNWEQSYSGMGAYSQSKIAFGLFGLALDRLSKENNWGISSNLAHPGVAPTNLLAARPELGRSSASRGRGAISLLSRLGILGTPESAAGPALMAATDPRARGEFFGPRGIGHLGGRPAQQKLYSRLRNSEEGQRVWRTSLDFAGAQIPAVN